MNKARLAAVAAVPAGLVASAVCGMARVIGEIGMIAGELIDVAVDRGDADADDAFDSVVGRVMDGWLHVCMYVCMGCT